MIGLGAIADPRALWYLTRGTGLVAQLLLTVSVVLGIVGVMRVAGPGWPRFVTAALHRNVSLFVLALLAVHIVTAVLDSFAPIGLVAVMIPFVSAYRTIWLGLGALAFDLLLALTITSLLRRRLGHRAWRTVHWAAYACWPIALVHGLGTGTDTSLWWVLAFDAFCVLGVAGAVWWRVAPLVPRGSLLRIGALGTATAALVAVVAWLATGPLQPGWARAAGTPSKLLAGGRRGGRSRSTAPASSPRSGTRQRVNGLPAAPFTAAAAGTVRQSAPNAAGAARVQIATTLSHGATGSLTITLEGKPLQGGGVALTGSHVTLGPASRPTLYRGRIVSLDGRRITAVLASPGHPGLTVVARLAIDAQARSATGRVSVRPSGGGANG